MPSPLAEPNSRGAALVRASWAGTGVVAASSAGAVAFPGAWSTIAAGASLLLFALGIGGFFAALTRAAARSRSEDIAVASLFLVAGAAPPRVVRHLYGSFAAQLVIGIVAAALRPFTAVAFEVLTPTFGLAVIGLWGARFGRFPPRAPAVVRGRR